MTQLLPCPFCGSEAEVQIVSGAYWVGCGNHGAERCQLLPWFYGRTETESAEIWNRRYQAPPVKTYDYMKVPKGTAP